MISLSLEESESDAYDMSALWNISDTPLISLSLEESESDAYDMSVLSNVSNTLFVVRVYNLLETRYLIVRPSSPRSRWDGIVV